MNKKETSLKRRKIFFTVAAAKALLQPLLRAKIFSAFFTSFVWGRQ
jgi:hypothetical protein